MREMEVFLKDSVSELTRIFSYLHNLRHLGHPAVRPAAVLLLPGKHCTQWSEVRHRLTGLTLGKILFILLLLFLCGVNESWLVDVGVVPPPVVDEHRDGVDHQEEEEAEYNYFLAVNYNWLPFPPTGTDLGTDTEL